MTRQGAFVSGTSLTVIGVVLSLGTEPAWATSLSVIMMLIGLGLFFSAPQFPPKE